jgi:hypothetical protein
MADTLVSVDYDRLAPQHGKNVTFRTNECTGCAADAIHGVDVRMLSLGAIGMQLALFLSLARLLVPLHLALYVIAQEKYDHQRANEESEKGVHKISVVSAPKFDPADSFAA